MFLVTEDIMASTAQTTTHSTAAGAKPRARLFWSALNVLLCSAIALVSFRYLFGVGPVPPLIFDNLFKAPWLVVHVAGAATALLVSPLQLIPAIRQGRPRLHRWLGRIYVVGRTIRGVAGLPLAFGSAAGPIATVGFGCLAVAWLATTLVGWRAGSQKEVAEHRRWMVRSFSLTYAAVTLRIYLAILPALPVAFVSGYRVVSFLCWVPNLLLAEVLLRRGRQSARAGRLSAFGQRPVSDSAA
jgi:uncharacterized membrane protein